MINQIYSVYDSKAKTYLPPFYMHTDGMALRIFIDTCNDVKHQFGQHPEDYTLFHLGEYDDNNAKFNLKDTPLSLGLGLELVRGDDGLIDDVVEDITEILKEQAQ